MYAKDVLVETSWVQEHLDDPGLRIVEVDENPALYAEAHIPGAIGFDWKSDLQDQVRRDFLGPEAFGEFLGSRGIGNHHAVVLYGDRNNWFAAYTYWYLKYYGHENVRLVNGPREKWIDEGRPTTAEPPAHAPETFRAARADESIRAHRHEVIAALGGPVRLVDVRSPQEYSGELIAMPGYEQEGAQRAGHIPGAASVPWAQAVRPDGTFKPRDELRELYTGKGVLNGDPIIAYCRIGERSAHTWFVLHELLGSDDVKNYDGSWTEWGNLVDVPIERSAGMRARAALAALLGLVVVAAAAVAGASDGRDGHEVWAVDQSNTNGTTSGGTIYVYDGRGLRSRGARPERIDLGGAATELCLAQTGSAPVRPHMLLFNTARSHAVLSFVASGHVLFLDARRRTPLACLDVGVQAHAAVPSPDESYVIVANQNGKLLHRIATDYRTNTFRLEPEATVDLATGTTPTGAPREDPALRPDNAPVCPLIDSSSRLAFVTLRGGGLFVLDSRATPMRIVAEYDRSTIHGNGCGGIETAGKMYVNSGGGTGANMAEFDVYAFDLAAFRGASGGICLAPAPNRPAPKLVVSQDDREHTDSHGATLTARGRHLWVADRSGNRIVVIATATDRVVGEIPLAGALSDDPSPDLLDVAPEGDRVYVSLRGALPLSGDPHVATGSTPGVGVIEVGHGGRTGRLTAVARISNPDAAGVDRADPHGLRVRER